MQHVQFFTVKKILNDHILMFIFLQCPALLTPFCNIKSISFYKLEESVKTLLSRKWQKITNAVSTCFELGKFFKHAISYQSTLSAQTAAVQRRTKQLLSMPHWILKARSPSSEHCAALQLILRPCHKAENGGGSMTNATLPVPLRDLLQKKQFLSEGVLFRRLNFSPFVQFWQKLRGNGTYCIKWHDSYNNYSWKYWET